MRNRTTHANLQAYFENPSLLLFQVHEPITSTETTDGQNSTWGIDAEQFGKIPVPKDYDEAMASKFSHRWKEAMEREIRELLGRHTWEAVDLPTGRK